MNLTKTKTLHANYGECHCKPHLFCIENIETPLLSLFYSLGALLEEYHVPFTVACVASVSVRFSARSRHFSFFSRAKHFFALAPIFARLKNEKCLERAENLTETLATQATFTGMGHAGETLYIRQPQSVHALLLPRLLFKPLRARERQNGIHLSNP